MLVKKISMLVKLYVGEDKTQLFALSKTCMLVKIFHQHTDFSSPTSKIYSPTCFSNIHEDFCLHQHTFHQHAKSFHQHTRNSSPTYFFSPTYFTNITTLIVFKLFSDNFFWSCGIKGINPSSHFLLWTTAF